MSHLLLLLIIIVGVVGVAVVGHLLIRLQYGKALTGPDRIDCLNDITRQFNNQIQRMGLSYRKYMDSLYADNREKDEIATLKKAMDVSSTRQYNELVESYKDAVNNAQLPPSRPKVLRLFWYAMLAFGLCACLGGCMGAMFTMDFDEGKGGKPTYVENVPVWSAATIPMPHLQDETQYVANPDGVLSDSVVRCMNEVLRMMDDSMGVESAVAVVYHIENDDPFRMAQDMGNNYGVGRDDRGLVIVVGYGDHSINISPGQSLEAELTDRECQLLEEKYVIPFMRNEQPDSAMLYLVGALSDLLQKKELRDIYDPGLTDEDFGIMAMMGYFGFSLLWLLLGVYLHSRGITKTDKERQLGLLSNPIVGYLPPVLLNRLYNDFGGNNWGGGHRGWSSHSSGRSWSGGSTHAGSYGGGHFGGGGATSRW